MTNKTPDKKKNWKAHVSSFFKANAVPLFWWAYTITILGVAVCLAFLYWEYLLRDAGLARNFILVIAALIGLPLAIWRSIVADRQSKTAQRQSETAQKQSETAQRQFEIAQRSLLNERYQKGAEMLGNEVLSVRLGGIYALERLAREHAEYYHVQIVKLFCAFVRNPPKDENAKEKNDAAKSNIDEIREDVQAIMTALGGRNKKQKEIEKQETRSILLYLAGAKLPFALLHRADLSGAFLYGANLSSARLYKADLSGAVLIGAVLIRADLSRAVLKDVRGLTQNQLDRAVADPDDPPKLEGAKCSKTGEPLVWRGKAPPSSSS